MSEHESELKALIEGLREMVVDHVGTSDILMPQDGLRALSIVYHMAKEALVEAEIAVAVDALLEDVFKDDGKE